MPAFARAANQGSFSGFRIEADAMNSEPTIAYGAEGWEVVITKKLSVVLLKAAPGFRMLDQNLFVKRNHGVDSVGDRAVSNALTADFDGDGKGDLIVIGTLGNDLTAMAALSNHGHWIVQAVPIYKDFDVRNLVNGNNMIENHVKYFPKGSMLPDRTGRKSQGAGFSFWDDDTGGDLFFLSHNKWVRAVVVGD